MPEPTPIQERVTQLEECFSHQEHLVEQLNQVVIQLRADIERMASENEEQKRQVKWLLENHPSTEEEKNEKPPHY